MSPHIVSRQRQSGAALALSLMVLSVLTIIGVVSMNATLLEMLAAGNAQFQTRALIGAENALVSAEDAASTFPLQTTYTTAGQVNIATSGELVPTSMSWNSSDSIAVSSTNTSNRYALEHAGVRTVEGNSVAYGETAPSVHVIRVTANSAGVKGAARTVQSIFVKVAN